MSRQEESNGAKATHRPFRQPEVRVDKRPQTDDLGSLLEVEKEQRELFVELRREGVVVADLQNETSECKSRVSAPTR